MSAVAMAIAGLLACAVPISAADAASPPVLSPPGPVMGWGYNSPIGNIGSLGWDPEGGSYISLQHRSAIGGTQTVQLAASNQVTLALQANGTIAGWGSNTYGQLGTDEVTGTFGNEPTLVEGIANAREIATGNQAALARLADGTVRAWGRVTVSGTSLGDADGTTASMTPVTVAGIAGAVSIAQGDARSVVADADGRVWSWGKSPVGNGTSDPASQPVQISGIGGPDSPKAVQVDAGAGFSVALLADGTLRAWGLNTNGQLGDGGTATQLTPVAPSGVTGVKSIAAGGHHILALREDGTVLAWGRSDYGQLGGGSQTTPVPGLTDVVAVAAGNYMSAAIRADGSLWTWGYNTRGQLGHGKVSTSEPAPARVGSLVVTGVAMTGPQNGDSHAVAIQALPAVATPAEATFDTQALGTVSPVKTISVTAGSLSLPIDRVRIGDGDVDQFLIAGDSCVGELLAPGESCEIRVRYAPSEPGSHAASVDVRTSTGVEVPQATVTGSGGELVQGPPGADGNDGRDGDDGAPGAKGDAGPVGAQGPKGDRGQRGPAGKNARVVCALRGKGAGQRVRCIVRYPGVGKSVAKRSSQKVARSRAALLRGGKVRARGRVASLRPKQRLSTGRYLLRIGRGKNATVLTVRVR